MHIIFLPPGHNPTQQPFSPVPAGKCFPLAFPRNRISLEVAVTVDCVLTQTTAPAVPLVDCDRNSPQLQDASQGFLPGLDQQELSHAHGIPVSLTQSLVTDWHRAYPVSKRLTGRMIFARMRTSRRLWRLWMLQTRTRRRILGVVSSSEWL